MLSATSIAQYRTLYNLELIPQSQRTNPANQPYSNVYVKLPQISAIQLSFTNTGFTYNDIFRQGTGDKADSLVVDLNNLENKLRDKNYFLTDVDVGIIGFGFRVREMYFNFNISQKSNISIAYPKGLISLRKGNGAYIGEDNPLNLSGFGVDAVSYTEFGFGASRVFNDKLVIGAKIKLYNGMANIQTKKSDIKLITEEETYDLNIQTDFEVNYSAPADIELDENNIISDVNFSEIETFDQFKENFIFNKNMGVGLDIGAVYQLNQDITLSGSIIDFGFISWKTNTTNLTSSGEFSFGGFDFSDDIKLENNDNNENAERDFFKETVDTLLATIEFEEKNNSYATMLPAKVYLAGSYKLNDEVNFGALIRSDFYDGGIHPSLSLAANYSPANWFAATLNYSMSNRTFNNLGIGLMLRGGPFQFYMVNDNINTLFWPKASKQVNMILGMNLVFGNKTKVEEALIEEL